ncbi:MAG TPA: peptidoglycan DD-metalloendopeptidase family protein [Tissierellaceae bacterium]|nr:peptidoglycan DD-metalloendopeptidase family protein [Tissierellaceae bacterium]
MNKKRITYLVLAIILAFNSLYIYAESLEELREKQKEVDQQIKDTKDEIKKVQDQTKDVISEIQELDKKVDQANVELVNLDDEILKLEETIDKTTIELEEAEENIENKQDTFNKRLKVMYRTGNVGYLEVLLSSTSIKDFLTRKDMVQAIAKHDTELIAYMQEQREIINSKKIELETQKKEVEISKNKVESRRRDLAKATRAKEDLIVSLEANHKALEKAIDDANEEAKKIESDIFKMQVNSGPYTGGKMNWPVPGHTRISSPYGYRIHPILNKKKFHTGIDIPAPTGTNIVAGSDGEVIHSGNLGGYGKVVIIDHGGGIVTLYAHNSRLVAGMGTQVKRGDIIARAGSTGLSTGPHLHFEVRKDGKYQDPLPWVKGQ